MKSQSTSKAINKANRAAVSPINRLPMQCQAEQCAIEACQHLGINPELWLEYHKTLNEAPASALFTYYAYIKHYGFNPFLQEIVLVKHSDHSWQTIITVDGWLSYMNKHPQFNGIRFDESDIQMNNMASWMQCSIYRHDRTIPITIREYFDEVKGDHDSWKHMPRRMLRHRVMSQCARVAFGISNPEPVGLAASIPSDRCKQIAGKEECISAQATTNGAIEKPIKRTQLLKQVLVNRPNSSSTFQESKY